MDVEQHVKVAVVIVVLMHVELVREHVLEDVHLDVEDAIAVLEDAMGVVTLALDVLVVIR